jgi:carbon-monoxide dehydrogenase medium subunit
MRPLPKFQYHAPKTLVEVVQLMDTLDNAKPIIGGTDVIPLLREAACRPSHLIDLNNVEELNYVREQTGFICIGATATYNQLATSELLHKAPAIVDAVSRIGSPQIRNRGSVSGNLCNASPAADSAPPLLVYDAELKILSSSDTSIVPLQELFAGPQINSLEPNELVTEIRFTVPPESSSSSFKRIARRKAFTLSIVSVAAYIEMDNSICKEARIAFGSVADTPIRSPEVEELLAGEELDAQIISKAAEVAKRIVSPITDVRGTAEYRRAMCGVLLKRALNTAIGRLS